MDAFLLSFGVILLAELGDKSQLMALTFAIDAEASRRGTTRSGLLRDLAEETLQRRTAERAQRMREIRLAPGERRSHGGGVAELVKTHRPQG